MIDLQKMFFMDMLSYYMNKKLFIGICTASVVVRCTEIIIFVKISTWNNTEQKMTMCLL